MVTLSIWIWKQVWVGFLQFDLLCCVYCFERSLVEGLNFAHYFALKIANQSRACFEMNGYGVIILYGWWTRVLICYRIVSGPRCRRAICSRNEKVWTQKTWMYLPQKSSFVSLAAIESLIGYRKIVDRRCVIQWADRIRFIFLNLIWIILTGISVSIQQPSELHFLNDIT